MKHVSFLMTFLIVAGVVNTILAAATMGLMYEDFTPGKIIILVGANLLVLLGTIKMIYDERKN